MAITFQLKDKKKLRTSIICITRFKGERYALATGISTEVDKWIFEKSRCKTGKTNPEGSHNNKLINRFENELALILEKHDLEHTIPTITELRQELLYVQKGDQESEDLVVPYMLSQIEAIPVERTRTNHRNTVYWLQAYQDKTKKALAFKDIDITFYRSFRKFVASREKPLSDNELLLPLDQQPPNRYSINYFGSLIKNLQTYMNRALEDNLHTSTAFKHKDFKVLNESSDTVYLSIEELKRIHSLKIDMDYYLDNYAGHSTNEHNAELMLKSANIVRNKFIIGAFTALRVSDFNRLDNANINDGYIRIRPAKGTKMREDVVIPIHPLVQEILDTGFDVRTPISDQKINTHIKTICKHVGITEPVQTVITLVDGSKYTRVQPKYKLVSTHTARRSAATNMFKAGIPAISIMKITGHKTESIFLKYIKVTSEQNAELMKQNQFFK